MSVKDCIKRRRTIRKFTERKIPKELLVSYIDCARLAPSGANIQPLKYAIVSKEQTVHDIFQNVKWAAYLKGAYVPSADEMPTAFIAVMKDKNIASAMTEFDAGAAVMSIHLAAEEDGVGCCIMGAIDRPNISRILGLEEHLELLYMIALGYKKEQPICADMEQGDVKYYVENHCLNVPKRKLEDILVKVD